MQVQRINVTIVSGRDVILEPEESKLERNLRRNMNQTSSLPETDSSIKAEPEAPEIKAE